MERYLNIDNIALALDGVNNLPSPEDLQAMMGNAEKMMFIRQGDVSHELKTTAWYLHNIATSRESLELYGFERRKRANQISAHIFDLALSDGLNSRAETLTYIFAGQIGYLHGDLSPNATALYRKLEINDDLSLVDNFETLTLELGVMLLALDRSRLFRLIPLLKQQAEEIGVRDTSTTYETTIKIIDAVWYILLYMSYGNTDHSNAARSILEGIVRPSDINATLDMRWVAAHLLDINTHFKNTSLWGLIPPEIPDVVVKAMTLGSPAVLSLWPPQIHLLGKDPSQNPLLLSTKRVFLSVPTSSGKTLMSQLFILSHLAQNGGGVCIVAPSNSLCREIKKSLMTRLRFMNRTIIDSLPDDYEDDLIDRADIEVMTPERLNFLIRNNLRKFLDHFTLFVVDEAHLVGDSSRGWGLESSLSLLNMVTQATDHRIIMMSSALGREGHIHQWLQSDGISKHFHSEWRGPRRLYAMYSSEIDRSINPTIIPPRTRRSHELKQFKLKGIVRLRIADASTIHRVSLREHVGQLTIQSDTGNRGLGSTPQYKSLVPLILSVAESGPVLVIEVSRYNALLMAKALADKIQDNHPAALKIADFASLRLGSEHPLPKVLRKGIAYHHAALPSDVQDAIEMAMKDGELKYIVATTTLAEGVNLPVRTVVISNTGIYRTGGEFDEFIKGPTLVNTIGRAGRSGKESEGWIILAGKFDNDRLNQLINTREEDLQINSDLTSSTYLGALEEFENLVATNEDAILTMEYSKVSNFISQVWAVFVSLEEMNRQISVSDLNSFLESTLAWRQIDQTMKTRWQSVAVKTLATYMSTDETVRRRWAKTGTSVKSATVLESVAREIFDVLLLRYFEDEPELSTEELIELMFSSSSMEKILGLPEHRHEIFKEYRTAPNDRAIQIDEKSLLLDWVNGVELSVLVERYLSDIEDIEFAYESLGTYLTSTFEHFLPWVIGTIIGWINSFEENTLEGRKLINPYFPQYIRYGVSTNIAVNLMLNGIRSRRLANMLSAGYENEVEHGYDLVSWLRMLSVEVLINDYRASLSEVEDFKNYINSNESTFLADLAERSFSQLTIFGYLSLGVGPVDLIAEPTLSGGHSIFLVQENSSRVELPIEHHRNIEMLIETGIPFEAEITELNEFGNTISVWLIDYDE